MYTYIIKYDTKVSITSKILYLKHWKNINMCPDFQNNISCVFYAYMWKYNKNMTFTFQTLMSELSNTW